MSNELQAACQELDDATTLRAGINLGNILLVTGRAANGDPEGVSPGMADALAERLGVAVEYRTYATPGEVADAGARNEWDVALIAEDPERAEVIDFADAYVEIVATYLVPDGSTLQGIDQVDQPGVRIAVSERSAYDLYLSRQLRHAELCRAKGLAGAFELFRQEKLDALAGLVPALQTNAESLPGSRVLAGGFTSVRQAMATRPGRPALNAFVREFIEESRQSNRIADLIDQHGVSGKLQVTDGGV